MIDTARLRLRPLVSSDVDAYVALHTDPLVMQFDISGGEAWTTERATSLFKMQSDQTGMHGWDRTFAITRGGDFIGRAGFSRAPTLGAVPVPSLGYYLKRETWGMGYATEAGSALMGWLGTVMRPAQALGIVTSRNAASKHVLAKLGFRHIRTVDEQIIGATEWHGFPVR